MTPHPLIVHTLCLDLFPLAFFGGFSWHAHFSFSHFLFFLFNLFSLFTFKKFPPSTVPTTLLFHTTTPSQRVSELLNWPVSEAELERALFPSAPELPAQTAKRELKIIEFMRKKDPRSLIFSGTRR